MTQHSIGIIGFSHVCIAVSNMEVSLPFYRDVLGLGVFFDIELEGPSMEVVTGEPGARGRMVGGMLGGTAVEQPTTWKNAPSGPVNAVRMTKAHLRTGDSGVVRQMSMTTNRK
jgi:catechol 2,3-dioxygenase-like lactoylglutathione lyase family enzyme